MPKVKTLVWTQGVEVSSKDSPLRGLGFRPETADGAASPPRRVRPESSLESADQTRVMTKDREMGFSPHAATRVYVRRQVLHETLLAGLFIAGCTSTVSVPLDATPLEPDKATILVYSEGLSPSFQILLDDMPSGTVTATTPLKFAVVPGRHNLSVGQTNRRCRRVAEGNFEGGKVHYWRLWLQSNSILGDCVHIAPVRPTTDYKALIR